MIRDLLFGSVVSILTIISTSSNNTDRFSVETDDQLGMVHVFHDYKADNHVQIGVTKYDQNGLWIKRTGDIILFISKDGIRARKDDKNKEEIFNLSVEDLAKLDKMCN